MLVGDPFARTKDAVSPKFRQLTYYFLWKVSQEYVKLYVVPGKLKLATSFIDEIVLKYKE